MKVIYFIQAINNPNGPVKIGYSKNPKKRLSSLQSGSPELLHIILTIKGKRDDEKRLHLYFEPLRLHGEWFSFEGYLKALLEDKELQEEILTIALVSQLEETTEFRKISKPKKVKNLAKKLKRDAYRAEQDELLDARIEEIEQDRRLQALISEIEKEDKIFQDFLRIESRYGREGLAEICKADGIAGYQEYLDYRENSKDGLVWSDKVKRGWKAN